MDVRYPTTTPLGGVQIVDFTSYLTGPWATCLLADQGARVIKVEPVGVGDTLRYMGTSRAGMSAVFAVANRNKRGIALDLKSPRGAEIARRLVSRADVVAENFRPGVAAKLGLDYAACHALKPDVIHLSISGYGDKGPYSQLPTFDSVIQAHSGMCYGQGNDASPEYVRQAICDKVTALYAAQGITAALFARARGAGGRQLQLSMFDSALAFHWPDGMNEFTFLDGEVDAAAPIGSLYRIQPTADGHIAVSPITNDQFKGYCRALGRPELADDPRLASLEGRVRNSALLRELRGALEAESTTTWCRRFLAEDVPHGPMLKREEVLNDAQVRHACVVEFGAPGGRTRVAVSPCLFDEDRCGEPTAAPTLGEHSRAILEELGFGNDEISTCLRTGAVQ